MDAARDAATHEQVPTASKFPGGFEHMIGRIHALPMKFGLYTAMGAQTCGKFAASCGHEALDAKTYAGWGVDFVKDDACGSCGADSTLDAYAAMQQGIWASGRSMVLSIEGQPDPRQSSGCGSTGLIIQVVPGVPASGEGVSGRGPTQGDRAHPLGEPWNSQYSH
jgi:hypothetical protein